MRQKTRRIVSGLSIATGVMVSAGILILDLLGMLYSIRGAVLIAGIIMVVLGLYFYPTRNHRKIIQVLFLLPLLVTFLFTVILPFLVGIYYSFTDWNGVKLTEFVGFRNYVMIFQAMDYVYSFLVTFVFTMINMLLVNVLAFGLALLCTSSVRGRNVYRAAFFMPNLIGGIVLGYVWQFMFNRVFTELIAGSSSMLANPKLAVLAIVIVSTWQYAGYIMMIYVTGIQGLPRDVMEASAVDGAKGLQKLRRITIPMIANTFTVCLFLTLVNSFKQFDLNYTITNGGPSTMFAGKATFSTEFLALDIYKTAIVNNSYAFGQSKAVIFFLLLAIVSLTQVALNKRKEVEL